MRTLRQAGMDFREGYNNRKRVAQDKISFKCMDVNSSPNSLLFKRLTVTQVIYVQVSWRQSDVEKQVGMDRNAEIILDDCAIPYAPLCTQVWKKALYVFVHYL